MPNAFEAKVKQIKKESTKCEFCQAMFSLDEDQLQQLMDVWGRTGGRDKISHAVIHQVMVEDWGLSLSLTAVQDHRRDIRPNCRDRIKSGWGLYDDG